MTTKIKNEPYRPMDKKFNIFSEHILSVYHIVYKYFIAIGRFS